MGSAGWPTKKFSVAFEPGNSVGTELGPVVDKAQYDRILKIIGCAQSEEQGTLLVGGRPVGSKGYYIEPTIFLDPKPDASIYKDEIFGPVAVVNKFKTEKEVLEKANDSRYGLMAGVFTENINRALRISSAFDSGVVRINCISTIHFSCPFGGTKESGLGRELGVNGEWLAGTEPKTVLINMNYGEQSRGRPC